MDRQTCVVIVEPRPRGGSIIPIAFDPTAAWGDRDEFYVHGMIQGRSVRGSITHDGQRWIMSLGPAWCRDAAVGPGREVLVDLEPEGPQVDDVPPELGELLRADPVARRAFEHLATFYRNGFVRPIADAKGPATRTRRAQQVMAALLAGRRAY
jgi:hypothetical protein